MSTDKNAFDTWLKKALYRDLGFRALFWVCISVAAALVAMRHGQLPAVAYFQQVAKSIAPLLNIFSTLALIVVLIGLMFKDLEYADDARFGHTTAFGKFGGGVRRTAGDLSLWVLGAVVALLSAATVAVIAEVRSGEFELRELPLLIRMYALVHGMFVLLAGFNILVRREAAPLALFPDAPERCKRPLAIAIIYLLTVAGLIIYVAPSTFG